MVVRQLVETIEPQQLPHHAVGRPHHVNADALVPHLCPVLDRERDRPGLDAGAVVRHGVLPWRNTPAPRPMLAGGAAPGPRRTRTAPLRVVYSPAPANFSSLGACRRP